MTTSKLLSLSLPTGNYKPLVPFVVTTSEIYNELFQYDVYDVCIVAVVLSIIIINGQISFQLVLGTRVYFCLSMSYPPIHTVVFLTFIETMKASPVDRVI